MVVNHWFRHSPAVAAAIATAKRADRRDAFCSTRAEHHRMSNAVLARLVHVVVMVPFTHARACVACEETGFTKDAHITTQILGVAGSRFFAILSPFPSPEQECTHADQCQCSEYADDNAGNGTT